MRIWLVGQAPFRDKPAGRLLNPSYVPSNIITEILDRQDAEWNGDVVEWVKLKYKNQTGWIYAGYTEEYTQKYPYEVDINIPSPNPDDAEQYIVFEGRTKYNMCGEIACAYIVGVDIKSLLDKWKEEFPAYYARIYKGVLDRGTGTGDLDTILKMYGKDYPSLNLYTELTDPVRNIPTFTPGRMKFFTDRYQIIIGCNINKYSGKLIPRNQYGAAHWAVVESVETDRIYGGLVTVYNPFCNRKEDYNWSEFKVSVGSPVGLLVKRE